MSDVLGESPADYAQAARTLAEAQGVVPTLRTVVENAVSMLGCEWAAIAATDHLGEKPARLSASNDDAIAATVAAVAGAAGNSPGILAFDAGRAVVVEDLCTDPRFPGYSRELLRRSPIRSVLALPFQMHDRRVGVLSCYSATPGTFDAAAVERGRVLAVHAPVAVEAARAELRADNLEVALATARAIGSAIGIVMERYQLDSEDAWELLRTLSQNSNRPLAVLASQLVVTGTVDGPPVIT